MRLNVGGKAFDVDLSGDTVTVDGRAYRVRVERKDAYTTVYVDDRPVHVSVGRRGDAETHVFADVREYVVKQEGRSRSAPVAVRAAAPAASSKGPLPPGGIAAHMTGRVLRIAVVEGATVAEGDLLLVLEAMKMENETRAPRSGTVTKLVAEAGQRVQQGELLLTLE